MVRWWFLPWTTERIWLTIVLLSLPKWLNPLLCRQQQQRSNEEQDFFERFFLLETQWKRTWWIKVSTYEICYLLLDNAVEAYLDPLIKTSAKDESISFDAKRISSTSTVVLHWRIEPILYRCYFEARSSHSPRDVRSSGSIGNWYTETARHILREMFARVRVSENDHLPLKKKATDIILIGWRYHCRFWATQRNLSFHRKM